MIEYSECERCKSGFPHEVCQQFCRLHNEMAYQRGFFSAYAQRSERVAKAMKNK